MRVIHFDQEGGTLKAEAKGLEDLWYLSMIVTPGARVAGRSFRRFASTGEGDRAKSGEKKPVAVVVEAEQVEFSESANRLRVTGKIISGEPEEYVQAGAYHTLDVEVGSVITVSKGFTAFDREMVAEAKKSARAIKAAVLALDERKATFSVITNSGIRHRAEVESGASKRDLKGFDEAKKGFFFELYKMLSGAECDALIVAGPGFAKDEFAKYVKEKDEKLFSKIRIEHASTAERNAASELLKRGAIGRLMESQRMQEEFDALEALKKSVAKDDGYSCYGPDEVAKAVGSGAASQLLVLDEVARKDAKVQQMIRAVRSAGGRVMIFNSQDDAGAEFKSFGIAAMLRYRSNY
jgi:protein pelota